MYFPNSKGDGRPWISLDGQTGDFKISMSDGDPEVIDAKGLKLGIDLHSATQGWLALGVGMRDWQPLDAEDEWGEKPSPDHRPGIEVDIICQSGAFGDEPVRVFNGASLAVTNFIAGVIQAVNCNLDDTDAIPTIRVKDIKKRSMGKGTSLTVDFDTAPLDKWMSRKDVMPTSDEAPATDTATEPVAESAAKAEDDDDNWDA